MSGRKGGSTVDRVISLRCREKTDSLERERGVKVEE